MFYLYCRFLKYSEKLKAVLCQLKLLKKIFVHLLKENLFVFTFSLSMSVTGGTVLARTVENEALSLPPWAEKDKHWQTKSLGLVDKKKKRKTSWSHNGKPPHCELTDVCQEWGSKRAAKLALVIDVMRERFEDDCLLSMPSRADNQELE